MSKRTLVILIIIAAVVLGLAVVLLVADEKFFKPAQNQPVSVEPQDQNVGATLPGFDSEPTTPAKQLNSAEQNIYFTSRNFSERYGSFSSDSGAQNIADLRSLATDALAPRLESQIKSELSAKIGYYGVASKAMKVDILRSDESTASVMVSLQRTEIKDNAQPFVFSRNLELSLVKEGDSWLISQANWQ